MTLDEIKAAVEAGRTVYWCNPDYHVIKDQIGQWLIVYQPTGYCFGYKPTGYCFGLTWTDDVTMNGKPDDFYEAETKTTGKKSYDQIGTMCPTQPGKCRCGGQTWPMDRSGHTTDIVFDVDCWQCEECGETAR